MRTEDEILEAVEPRIKGNMLISPISKAETIIIELLLDIRQLLIDK